MFGIIFFGTKNLESITNFYLSKVGANVWLEQEDCIILKFKNMLFGFCQRKEADRSGTITFVYENEEKVDDMYEQLTEQARTEPQEKKKYRIYQFFAEDPEGRTIEFQTFLHEIPEVS